MSIARVDDLLRAALLRAGRVLPLPRRKGFARQVRGWHEARHIGRANAVVLSHAKSGRTWLATMLAAYERAVGAPVGVFFSHDNYIRDWTARGAQPGMPANDWCCWCVSPATCWCPSTSTGSTA